MQTKLPLNTILQGNSLELLKTLPDSSVDLIFADIPYWMRVEGVLYIKGSESKSANLTKDGKLEYNGEVYDIHSLCAKLKGVKAQRLNGFLWWEVVRLDSNGNESKILLDLLREKYRERK